MPPQRARQVGLDRVGKVTHRCPVRGNELLGAYLGPTQSRAIPVAMSEAVSQYAQQAGNRLRDRYGDLSDQARERIDHAQDVVRHNPSQSVAAAFGIGLVAGLVVGLALRSR